MVKKSKLSLYLKNRFNVLLIGRHGVGKTAIIKEVFEEAGLKWKYFSAPTMDPWVDFIGVPKTTVLPDGLEVLSLVKPEAFARDEIEALFFDEFNRASKKVKDAVMELIQFKSINGRKFENLKVIWASINPYDEENTYDVERLDPALQDRFQIVINVPYELDSGYLLKTHGDEARGFITWWKELPFKIKLDVSPRRLDYAISVYKSYGDLADVLPRDSNITKLKEDISKAKLLILDELLEQDSEKKRSFFTVDNSHKWLKAVLENPKYNELIVDFHPEIIEQNIQSNNENLITLLFSNGSIHDRIVPNLSSTTLKVFQESYDAVKTNLFDIINSKHYTNFIEIEKAMQRGVSRQAILTKLYGLFTFYMQDTSLPTDYRVIDQFFYDVGVMEVNYLTSLNAKYSYSDSLFVKILAPSQDDFYGDRYYGPGDDRKVLAGMYLAWHFRNFRNTLRFDYKSKDTKCLNDVLTDHQVNQMLQNCKKSLRRMIDWQNNHAQNANHVSAFFYGFDESNRTDIENAYRSYKKNTTDSSHLIADKQFYLDYREKTKNPAFINQFKEYLTILSKDIVKSDSPIKVPDTASDPFEFPADISDKEFQYLFEKSKQSEIRKAKEEFIRERQLKKTTGTL